MKTLHVLIACECSGTVRRAFRSLGHNAWSCDTKPAEDGSNYHIQGDCFEAIARGCQVAIGVFVPWDLVIAHPPCTRLCNSGALRLYKGGKFENGRDHQKWDDMERAALFFRRFIVEYSGPLCLENPVMHGHAREMIACDLPRQSFQPYEFGADASKRTCLWLRGLPPLKIHFTWRRAGRIVTLPSGKLVERWANQTDSGQNRLGPSDHRASDRARTYQGIAWQMASQWSAWLLSRA